MEQYELRDAYRIVSDPRSKDTDVGNWMVELLIEPYNGLLYKYIKFGTDGKEGTTKMAVEYDILYVPETLTQTELPDEQEKDLGNLICEICLQIVEDYLIVQNEKNGKDKIDIEDMEPVEEDE